MKCPHCKCEIGLKKRKFCINKVPKTYAEKKIKQYIKLCEGIDGKGQLDIERYKGRIENLKNKEIGSKFPINKIRVNGFHGQEEREAFNFLICSGKYKKEQIKINDKKYVEYFIRVDNEPCKFLNMNDIEKKDFVSCELPKSEFKPKFN